MGITGVIVESIVLNYIMGLRPFVSLGTLTEDDIIVEEVKTFPLVFIFMYLLGSMLSILSQEVIKTLEEVKTEFVVKVRSYSAFTKYVIY
ncbi:hypothetical protein ACQKMN_08530 [Ureibacillus composti]